MLFHLGPDFFYTVPLLKVFIRSGLSYEVFRMLCVSCHLQVSLVSLFHFIYLSSFMYFSFLTAVAITLCDILNNRRERGHSCPILLEMLLVFPHSACCWWQVWHVWPFNGTLSSFYFEIFPYFCYWEMLKFSKVLLQIMPIFFLFRKLIPWFILILFC